MNIQNGDILEMVKYKAKLLLPSNMKSYKGFRLAYLHLKLTNSKGQGQVMNILMMNILNMVKYRVKIIITKK